MLLTSLGHSIYSKMSIQDLDLIRDLSGLLRPERVLSRPLERVAYASDASLYSLVPRVVVQPVSIEEVRRLFGFSKTHSIPLTFRAAGTSLSGQSITDGILVDISKHWGGIQIEASGDRVRLQPGIIGAHVNARLRSYQRRIGPDPASIDACMVGGILANNASGMCCGVVENAYHTLHALTLVLPDGLVIDTGAPDAERTLKGEASQIWNGLLDLRKRLCADERLRERVHTRYQTKNTNGYSLNALLDYANPLDMLAHLMIGSEGTLGFIAEATLNTLVDFPLKYTGLLYFRSVQDAADAILSLRDSGARAVEIMDRAALRSVENLPGAPSMLAQLPENTAGLLVEYQCSQPETLENLRREAARSCSAFALLSEPKFTQDADEQAALWKLRKGMFPSIGATRRQGTTVIIEDVAFPIPRLAEAIGDQQTLFHRYGYSEGIIFGHAKDGNLHFVITQSFNTPAEVQRYESFMSGLVRLVSGKYDGALKAEHGTGRNMAPFVETEWGASAYAIMQDLKSLFDPAGFLNPGVIINPNPHTHVADLKTLPVIEAEVDRCIECGFCEPYCPSRRLTLTPRQRIVVRREIARQKEIAPSSNWLFSLVNDFNYAGLDTCAVDGLCATSCPVNINTGDLVKHLRAGNASPRAQQIALSVSQHFKTVERSLRPLLWLGHLVENLIGVGGIRFLTHAVERLTGWNLPEWNNAVPHPTWRVPSTPQAGVQFVYFPSCLSRAMGKMSGSEPSLIETFLTVAQRAAVPVWIPKDTAGHCCGMPFGSKGYDQAYHDMLHRTLYRFWEWSDGGRMPIIIDASSCTYTLRSCSNVLSPEDRKIWQKLTILDSLEFVHDELLPRLKINHLSDEIILHPTCAARKLNLTNKFLAVAKTCANSVVIPQSLDCCGFAGDRGLLFPELTASATALESAEVNARSYDGYYSSNLTCEMGVAAATGKPYRSFLYLLEQATR
jgi:D-lactate dehydrogenase